MSAVQPLLKGEVSRRDGGVKRETIKEAIAGYKNGDAREDVCVKRAGVFIKETPPVLRTTSPFMRGFKTVESTPKPLLKGEVSRRDGGVKKGTIKEAIAGY